MKVLIAVALASVACVSQAQWRNALAPRGKSASPITLASRGKPTCVILVPASPTTQETKAAADLQQWLAEMSGVTIPIIAEARASRGRVISIGRTAMLAREVAPTADLADEGYGIAVKRGNVFLWGGRTRGVINAVYALLEEDMGCRWYTRDSMRLPKAATLRVAPVPRTYVPQLRLRDPFYFVSFDATWSLRNRTNAPDAPVPEEWGGRIDYGPLFVHTFHQLMPPDRYFAEHPEYYMLDANGRRNSYQLCTTNPDTIRLVTEAVLKAFREHPHAELASVFKMDGGGICHCPRCTEMREAEGADMACQLFMVNQVADAVAREFPRATVDTLAYLDTIGVPKTVRPRPNVAIRLCNDTVGSWAYPFTPARKCKVADLVRAWSAVCKRIYIWDYNTNFSHYLAPMPNMEVIADNIHFYSEVHSESGKGWMPSFRLGPYKSSLANLPDDETRFPAATWFRTLLREGVQSIVLNSAVMSRPSPPGQGRSFRPDGSNLPWVIVRLQEERPDRYRAWLEHLSTSLPDIAGIRIVERPEDRHRYLMIRYAHGVEVPSWGVSDGTLRLMALTLLAYLGEPGGIFLIEEPENGIHPRAVETMYQALSSVYDSQILVASHSPVLLANARLRDVLCFGRTKDGATDIVSGEEHPQLRDWHEASNPGLLLASGVL